MGHSSIGLREGGGPHQLQKAGVPWSEEARKSYGRPEEAGRQRGMEEETSFPEERKAGGEHFLSKAPHGSPADCMTSCSDELGSGLCSEVAFDPPCKAASSQSSSTCSEANEEGPMEGQALWSKLQVFSFSRWASMLVPSLVASGIPFAEFLKSTLHCQAQLAPASEKALFPICIAKLGVFGP